MNIRATRSLRVGSEARIYGPTYQICPCPIIFVGDVSPMNVTGYIYLFHITDEYIVTFVGTNE
jgi:hypothetical protein